jgi:snurportin-1
MFKSGSRITKPMTSNRPHRSHRPFAGKRRRKQSGDRSHSPHLHAAELPPNPTTPKAPGQKRNQWADRCMYAELLELNPGPALNPQLDVEDGLPDDLDTEAWIAISGVPVGKRCLAVTYTSSGIAGTGANFPITFPVGLMHDGTDNQMLAHSTSPIPMVIVQFQTRSYGPDWWGNTCCPHFPSILPQNTILDCILDQNWTQNGILHVLDVIKWKGQDIGDCETSFR